MPLPKGFKHSEATKKKIKLACIGKHKGELNSMYGKHFSEEVKQKISLSRKGKAVNEKHPFWKGNDVGYFPLHTWIRRHFKQPEKCEFCDKMKPLDLANVTGIYNREFKNWKYLCKKCHWHLDKSEIIQKRNPITGRFE